MDVLHWAVPCNPSWWLCSSRSSLCLLKVEGAGDAAAETLPPLQLPLLPLLPLLFLLVLL